ncbi:MAG: helix-turn-helix domain-containing protein [Nanoarchaeota archaeon]
MEKKYVVVSLDDEKTRDIADVLGSKTSNKILKYLAEKEGSEGDVAKDLGMKLNTVEYNLKKLIRAGFVVKSGSFFWSKKGRKISTYKLADKSILISPKTSIVKSIIPVALLSGLTAYLVSIFSGELSIKPAESEIASETVTRAGEVMEKAVSSVGVASEVSSISGYFSAYPTWAWFLLGAWFALVILLLWNWRKL